MTGRTRAPQICSISIAIMLCCPALAQPQTDVDFRVGVSELCTTCNDVVRCERLESVQDGPSLVLYNLLEDSFWQQIATIWDYLVQFISPKTDDLRAMTIYELEKPDQPPTRILSDQKATVDAATQTIRLPEGIVIDQRDGRWWQIQSDGSESRLGSCELLSFADGRELISRLAPETNQD